MGEEELPGMREHADTSGGGTDSRSGEPFRCSRCRKNSHCQGATVNCDCLCTGAASPAPASRTPDPYLDDRDGNVSEHERLAVLAALPGEARRCWWVDPAQDPGEHGYVPSLVTEGEAGHSPMRGDPGKLQAPWHWGRTLAEAEAVCADLNARDFGLTPSDASHILLSSMAAQFRGRSYGTAG